MTFDGSEGRSLEADLEVMLSEGLQGKRYAE